MMLCGALAVGGTVAWQLWGTGLTTAKQNEQLRADLLERIAAGPARPTASPDQRPAAPEPGGRAAALAPAPAVADEPAPTVPRDAVAVLRIPKIGLDVAVVEGTSPADLQAGPGHYVDTAYPWDDTGATAIAGHRTTYGAPFWSLNNVVPDDEIEVLTERGAFRYRVTGSLVVDPSDTSVLRQTDEPTLVLTTCTPRFLDRERLIVFADRV